MVCFTVSRKDFKVITFKIIHHVPGRIRIEVPAMRGLSVRTLKRLSFIPIPAGIKDVRPNPVNGSLVIKYDHEKIDIIKYIEDVVSSKEIQGILKGDEDEYHY